MKRRRWLAAAAWCVAFAQLTLGTIAPVFAARAWERGFPAPAMADKDCCAGSHPGQACPMHRRQASPEPVSDRLCRLTCAEPDAYATWLATAIGWVPDLTRWTYREPPAAPVAAPAATPLLEVALTPLAPPPRP